jgi:hypothetical protein
MKQPERRSSEAEEHVLSRRNILWAVVFTVFWPLIYVPVAFVVFFVISWFLAVYVFVVRPLPFWLFAVTGLVLGAASVAINLWRTWPALMQLFSRETNESAT